jgi:hypothetical protein
MQLLLALALVILGIYLACVNIAQGFKSIELKQSRVQQMSNQWNK